MEDYIKATKQKIKQLEREINESSASHNEKRNMQHSISKINIFSGDVFDDAIKLRSELTSVKEENERLVLKNADLVIINDSVKEQLQTSEKENNVLRESSEMYSKLYFDRVDEIDALQEYNTKLVEALEVLISDDPGILEIPKVASVLSFKADTNKTKDK